MIGDGGFAVGVAALHSGHLVVKICSRISPAMARLNSHGVAYVWPALASCWIVAEKSELAIGDQSGH